MSLLVDDHELPHGIHVRRKGARLLHQFALGLAETALNLPCQVQAQAQYDDGAQQNGELVLERDSVHGPPHPLLRDMPDGSGPLDGRPV